MLQCGNTRCRSAKAFKRHAFPREGVFLPVEVGWQRSLGYKSPLLQFLDAV